MQPVLSEPVTRRRIRLRVLRAGYVALAAAFVSIAASPYVGAFLLLGLLLALAGAILLVFSRDELPRYAGLGLILYFLVSLAVFVASTPTTIRSGGANYFVNDDPNPALAVVYQDLLLGLPLMVAGALTVAVWERERAPRLLTVGALVGGGIWFVLFLLLAPGADVGGVNVTAEQAALSASRAVTNARLMDALLALSALCGAAGAGWASARPDEYA